MSKARHDRRREKQKNKRREEKLNSKNEFDVSDPVPREAIDRIISGIRLVNTNVS